MRTTISSLSTRVNYAIACIKAKQTDSRKFSSCFEMGDGDDVVRAIMYTAQHDNELLLTLRAYLNTPELWAEWNALAPDYPTTTVTNLATRETKTYNLPATQAVIAAHAQEHGDFNTWNYPTRYGHLLQQSQIGALCGDWYAFKTSQIQE